MRLSELLAPADLAAAIEAGHVTRKQHPELRHGIFAEDSPESHWLAGLLAADGCVKGDRSWALTQSGNEGHATIEYVRTLVGHQLGVYEHTPARGATARTIYVPSREMVADLQQHYGIGPRKTLTYTWPMLDGEVAADFLAGYIDGDGCIGTYRTPKGEPFLHISFVGTVEFMTGAQAVIPANGKLRCLTRCKNLAEIRYSGRHAWAAGAWLYGSEVARKSRKYPIYESHVTTARPTWLIASERRERVRQSLADGLSLRATAARTGEHLGTVCAWKKQFVDYQSFAHGMEDN